MGQMNTLRRYKKHFKVTSRPGVNKAQLADTLTRHFKTIPVVEKEALTYFIYMIKQKGVSSTERRRKLQRIQTEPVRQFTLHCGFSYYAAKTVVYLHSKLYAAC